MVNEVACARFVVLSDKDSGEVRHCYELIISNGNINQLHLNRFRHSGSLTKYC
jgi:hypothetical protein